MPLTVGRFINKFRRTNNQFLPERERERERELRKYVLRVGGELISKGLESVFEGELEDSMDREPNSRLFYCESFDIYSLVVRP